MNIKSDSKPFFRDSDKNIQTKIKICQDKVNRNFKGKKKETKKRQSVYHYYCQIALSEQTKSITPNTSGRL